jgi:pyruvate/2-oxoglutarate dehydrogenase complex dihydrolipoamide acyltransferase (E2) component
VAKRPCLAAFVGVDHSDYLHDAIASEIAADTRSHHAKPKGEAAGAPAAAPARRAFDENLLVALAAAAEPAVDELEIADAVVRAISAHGRVELRAKLYATVLLTGSCAGVAGLGPRLRDAIGRRLLAASDSPSAALPPTPVEVLVSTKAEPRHVAWRGATLVAASEPMHELWIQQGEWLNGGSRVLRERIPFSW